MYGSLKKISVT